MNFFSIVEFKSFDDLWMFAWETTDLKDEVQTLMDELSPLYKKIHAYVRFHLKNKYPDAMPDDGTIPAHLLGNMWGQQWSNLLNVIPEMNPYSNVSPIDNMVNENLQVNSFPFYSLHDSNCSIWFPL